MRLDVAEHDADARQQDQIERDEQRGVADVGVLKAERDEPPERGEQVQAKHGPPLVDPERNQAVRQMIAAAAHRTAAGQPPRHADERRVEDRDEQDEQRNRRHRGNAGFEARRGQQRRASQERSEKEGPAVSHEDRGGPRVVEEKSQGSADEGRDRECQRHRASGGECRKEERPCDGGNAGRETVDVIEQVEGVGDADDPDERQQAVHRRNSGDVGRGHQEHDDRRNDGLDNELGRRSEAEHIVDRTESEHEPSADEQRQQRLERRAEERDAKKGAGNRVAAEDRNRVGMPPVALWLRQEAAPARQLPHERSKRDREREASEKRQQGGCGVHEIRRSPDVRKSSGTRST